MIFVCRYHKDPKKEETIIYFFNLTQFRGMKMSEETFQKGNHIPHFLLNNLPLDNFILIIKQYASII